MKQKKDMTVLVVDDEVDFLRIVARSLKRDGYGTLTAATAVDALKLAMGERPDITLLDIRLPYPREGIEVLKMIRMEIDPLAVIVMMTAYPVISDVVECMSMGAFSYIQKERIHEDLPSLMAKASKEVMKRRKLLQLGTPRKAPLDVIWMERNSEAMICLWNQVDKAAANDMSVIIQGNGTVGKERLARIIQEFSGRRGQPFIHVDCRRGAEHLSDEMFFGGGTKTEKKGAGGIGFLKAAGHGVLFLDEIGDLHPDAQKWLVAPFSQRIFRRSGSGKFIPYVARTIVSTTEPLDALSHCGKFNLDLCHALGRFTVKIPPLSRRKEDIEKIALGILRNARLAFGSKCEGFSDEVKAFFLEYAWPGEIKEMENVIYRAVSGLKGGRITLKDLPPELKRTPETRPWFSIENGATKKEKMLVVEKRIVESALEESGWDALKAAEKLKISRSEIYRDMARFDLKKLRGC